MADWFDFNAAQHGVFRGKTIVIFTVNGAGVTMWDGYAADMARELCKQHPWGYWQPIGYDSKPTPMKPGIDQGTAEFVRQLLEVHPTGLFMGIFYSEGAIIGSNILDILRDPSSPIHHRYKDFIAAVTYGNPRREQGHTFPGGIPVSGFGIVEPNLEFTPTWWWDFANGSEIPGSAGEDLYTTCSDASGQTLKNMRDVWKSIYTGDPGSTVGMVFKTIFLPWKWAGGVKTIVKAGAFFGSGTRPHIDYHVSYPIAGDPRDAWRIGFDYLAGAGSAAARPSKATPADHVLPHVPSPPAVPAKDLFPPVR
jgi:hypothetical protein